MGPQVDSGKIVVSVCAPPEKVPSSLQPSSVDATAEGGVPNASLAFDFLSATFGATLPRGHVTIVPSLPEDACSPLAPLDGRAEMKGEEIGGDVGGYGGGDGPAVLVKRGGCSFGVKAKNVQVKPTGTGERKKGCLCGYSVMCDPQTPV